jgi:hypothetical protein
MNSSKLAQFLGWMGRRKLIQKDGTPTFQVHPLSNFCGFKYSNAKGVKRKTMSLTSKIECACNDNIQL